MTRPDRLSASCSREPVASDHVVVARASDNVPTAGTVVTEMKTPTSVDDFDVVSETMPATPASSAMTNDHPSG